MENKSEYTPINFDVINNKNLSIGAKGLFMMLRSLAGEQNSTLMKDLIRENHGRNETEAEFNTMWKELVDNNYLKEVGKEIIREQFYQITEA